MSLLTIGHSNHDADTFVRLAQDANVDVIVDVRTAPYSQYTPHFSQEPLKQLLVGHGIGWLERHIPPG